VNQLAVRSRADSALIPAAVLAGVLAAAAAGWLVLAERMAGMDNGPGGDPGALGWFAGTWAVMTAAMMLPATAPALLRQVRGRRSPTLAVVFLVGYGAVWMLAGLLGYALVQAARGPQLGVLAWSSAGRYLAGAAIVAAGLYQLTATKRRWLARCTAAELPHRRDGPSGVLLAGLEHGGCCVACCWTLMIALYALGMMSIAWMALLTVLIAGERLLRPATLAVQAVAAVLVVLGIAVTLAPTAVPALTIPSQSRAMTMGMGMGAPMRTGTGVRVHTHARTGTEMRMSTPAKTGTRASMNTDARTGSGIGMQSRTGTLAAASMHTRPDRPKPRS
jgi:hypothetical protein